MKSEKRKSEMPAAYPPLTQPKGTPHPACGHVDSLAPARSALRASDKSDSFRSFPNSGSLPSAEKGSNEMLTKEELAAKLKVSVRSIENWKHDGYLPFLKIANVVRFHWPTVLSQLHEKQILKR